MARQVKRDIDARKMNCVQLVRLRSLVLLRDELCVLVCAEASDGMDV